MHGMSAKTHEMKSDLVEKLKQQQEQAVPKMTKTTSTFPISPEEIEKNPNIQIIRRIIGENLFGHNTICHMREHTQIVDQPTDLGGNNAGLSPLECVLCGLAGCLSIHAHKVADEKGWTLTKISFPEMNGSIDTRGDKGEKDPKTGEQISSKFQRITIRCKVEMEDNLDDGQMEWFKNQVYQRCPVSATLQDSGCLFDDVWQWE